MQPSPDSFFPYERRPTLEVKVGDLLIGNFHPIRLQTMTTADTMDTMATVEESIRCIKAGAELVRITAPSKKEAENLLNIKNELRKRGYNTPLVADIHFTEAIVELLACCLRGEWKQLGRFSTLRCPRSDYTYIRWPWKSIGG